MKTNNHHIKYAIISGNAMTITQNITNINQALFIFYYFNKYYLGIP